MNSKALARYLDAVVDGHRVHAVAWTYRDPTPAYEALRDHVAFYPGRVDVAWMGDERVQAQASDFYGGWITADLVGPFKGPPETLGCVIRRASLSPPRRGVTHVAVLTTADDDDVTRAALRRQRG